MDSTTDIMASEWNILELYCDWTASAVGRLSVRIFGLDTCTGESLLLTNNQRDLDEDAMLDRRYLYWAALSVATIDVDGLDPILSHPGLGRACAAVVARAWVYFREADWRMAAYPCAAVRVPRLISIAYAGGLDKLCARGWAPPRTPAEASRLCLIGGILRYGLI